MKVVIKKPGENPVVAEIDNDLKTLQKTVGGYIEIMPLPKSKLVIIMDEEGKLKDRLINLYLRYKNRIIDWVCGDIIISTTRYGKLRGLTDEEVLSAFKFCKDHVDLCSK